MPIDNLKVAINGAVLEKQVEMNGTEYTSSSIKEYITRKAIEFDISTTTALWIAEKESNFEIHRIGDSDKDCPYNDKKMKSIGLWQIEINCYNTDISEEFAKDIASSTDWAMKEMQKGNYRKWSVWRFCKLWFTKTCPL